MNHISFHQYDKTWNQSSGIDENPLNLKGKPYLYNKSTNAAKLAIALLTASGNDNLTQLLQNMNGFYAWVQKTPGGMRAAVDHIRSFPLFYSVKNGDLFLSDDAEWVRKQVGDEEMDPLSRDEFVLAGYVTGKDTLYPQVKQLQAGEYLEARTSSNGIQIITQRYYRFWHQEPTSYKETELSEKLEQATLNAMHRLVEQAAGRQIVIPLSGGYDSRLIASMLKKLEYNNVVCFTYGVPGNREAEYSRKVAQALGFRWLFVEYSEDIWRDAWRSQKADEYRKIASNHTSLPHIQDWLAINKLVNDKLIEPTALIAPGHSGDFVAGSHIPDIVFSKNHHTYDDLLQAIANNHLSNAPKSGTVFENQNLLNSRLLDRISADFDNLDTSFANLYEMWDWQERQAKYIMNSVRVYDQFNLQWWTPLWDLEFIQFWENVPLNLRKQRLWFKQWISIKYSEQSEKHIKNNILNNASDPTWKIKILAKIAAFIPISIKLLIKKTLIKIKPNNHFLGFEGLIPKNIILNDYLLKNYNMIGIYSKLYLSDRWGK